MNQSHLYILMALIGIISGCSGRPSAVKPIDVDAGDAAAEAIAQYDKDGDAALDDQELTVVPGILKWKQLYDTDSDGKVSEEEIEIRIDKWSEQKLGFRPMRVIVTWKGRPLSNARVEFIPEPYLGDNIKPAEGTTNAQGLASVSVAQEDLPEALKERNRVFRGVTGGTYKILVTHPQEKLPPKYNSKTTLGVEVAIDTLDANYRIDLE